MDDAGSKTKRSTIACTFCRERKIKVGRRHLWLLFDWLECKCDNNNDGQPCGRCTKVGKECEYKPVNPTTPPAERSGVRSITSNVANPGKHVMGSIVHLDETPTLGSAWGRPDPLINPTLSRSPVSDGPPFSFQGQPQGHFISNEDYQRPIPHPIPNQQHLQFPAWQYSPQHVQYPQGQGGFPSLGGSSNPNHDHMYAPTFGIVVTFTDSVKW